LKARSVEHKHTKTEQAAPVHPNHSELPEYLTVPDLMAILRVSRNTVYRLLGKGEVPFVKTGSRSIRVRREAFEAWRRAQEDANTEEEVSKKKGPVPAKVEAFDPQKGSNHAIVHV
jgi:excisionase family DNA binding protein